MLPRYDDNVQLLKNRILDLIPSNPQILSFTSPFDFLDIEGFEYKDLEPSTMQLCSAAMQAFGEWNEKQ